MRGRIKKIFSIILIISLVVGSPHAVLGATNAEKLIDRIGYIKTPLLEYDDPIIHANAYKDGFIGVSELFLANWSLSSLWTGKNKKWQNSYEQNLLVLLEKGTFVDDYLSERTESLYDAVALSVNNIANLIDNALLKSVEHSLIAGKWMTVAKKETIKNELLKSQVKMEILSLISINTKDENLKAACQNCINTVYSQTLNEIKTDIIEILVDWGISKRNAKTLVTNQIIMTPTKELFKMGIRILGECAKGVSYALVILDAKDLVTFVTGAQSRTNAYMNIVSQEIIYYGAREAYIDVVKQYKDGDKDKLAVINSLFHLMLEAKQEAYSNLPDMLGKNGWNKLLGDNSKVKKNYSEIQKITILNYKVDSNSSGIKVEQCSIKKIESKKQRRISLSWGKVSKADGYQIYRSKSKDGTYTKRASLKSSELSYTDKVINGDKYYYKVRAYRTVDGKKIYGKFSKSKSCEELSRTWYKNILSKKSGSFKVKELIYMNNLRTTTVLREDFTYYKTIDINKDGTTELLLATPRENIGFDNRVLILTYYNNKVTPLLCYVGNGARGKVYTDDKQVILCNSSSSDSYRIHYKISDGKLKKVRDMVYINLKVNGKLFYVNGKRVSESTWRKVMNSNALNIPQISFTKIK